MNSVRGSLGEHAFKRALWGGVAVCVRVWWVRLLIWCGGVGRGALTIAILLKYFTTKVVPLRSRLYRDSVIQT